MSDDIIFDRYTETARTVIRFATVEAHAMGYEYIGCEHLLLGLRRAEGIAARVLEELGIKLAPLRGEVERILSRADPFCPTRPETKFTPRAKKVLELALREALSFGHNYIGTEHILLGLVREDQNVGNHILQNIYGHESEAVRGAVRAHLRPPQQPQRMTRDELGAWIAAFVEGIPDEPLTMEEFQALTRNPILLRAMRALASVIPAH